MGTIPGCLKLALSRFKVMYASHLAGAGLTGRNQYNYLFKLDRMIQCKLHPPLVARETLKIPRRADLANTNNLCNLSLQSLCVVRIAQKKFY